MPGCATHYLFGIDVYHSMENMKIKNIIKKHLSPYRLGLQGPDLFFYHLPYLKHDDYRNIGSYMHEHNVNLFFKEAFSLIPLLSDQAHKEICLSYLSGFLCHYVLDYMGHPFVYARTNYSVIEYRSYAFGNHAALELELDRHYLHEKKGFALTKFSPNMNFALSVKEAKVISNYLSICMKKTFGPLFSGNHFPLTPHMIRLIIMEAKIESILQMDTKNRKTKIISKIEDKFFHYRLLTYKLITDEPFPIPDYLNENHELWNNPWNIELFSNDSFDDIYNRSLKECIRLFEIIEADAMFTIPGVKKQLASILDNLADYSYHSGLPISQDTNQLK